MADYSAKLREYLNKNYSDYVEDANGNKHYHCVFNGNYYVKCLVTETVVRKLSSNHGPMTKYNKDTYPTPSTEVVKTESYYICEKEDDTTGKLSFFVPAKAFTAEEIKAIIGTSEYNKDGIVE